MSRRTRIRIRQVAGAGCVLLLLAAAWNAIAAPFAVAGLPLYPDLQTAKPANLFLQTQMFPDGTPHVLLRFDNVIENHGGRLEVVANLAESRDLFQNVYDDPIGGSVVAKFKMQADLIFHPTHNHFHVTDFSTYRLYKKNSAGDWVPTSKAGTKTSFCITDSIRVSPSAPSVPGYRQCSSSKQGLSAGWSDLYSAGLPEQWVDTGPSGLSDGEYALHSTADPLNRIRETNDGNNTAITIFRIQDGALVDLPQAVPYCAAKPTYASAGTPVSVTCTNLDANESFSLHWRYDDAPPVGTAVSSSAGSIQFDFVMPPAPWGVHYLHVTSDVDTDVVRALIQTAPTLLLSRTSGRAGQPVDFTVSGFTADQSFRLTVPGPTGAPIVLASGVSDENGSAAATFTIPRMTADIATLTLRGTTGGKAVRTSLSIIPILRVGPSTLEMNSTGRIKLDGFGSYEQVRVQILATGRTLRTVTAGPDGSVTPGLASSFRVPGTMTPGRHTLIATGQVSGITATFVVTVTGSSAAEIPTPAPTATASPTTTATATPSPESTTEPTFEPTVEATPEFTATPTPVVEPTLSPPTPTVEPTPATQPTIEATIAPEPTIEVPVPDGTPAT